MYVFMRAHEDGDLEGKPLDILCPIDSFKVVIKGESNLLYVKDQFMTSPYYMSEKQYNYLLMALKDPSKHTEGKVLDGSVK